MSKLETIGKPEKKVQTIKVKKPEGATRSTAPAPEQPAFVALHNHLGNAAVQRLLAQRSGDGAFDLDDETAGRINRARGSGQPLDAGVQQQMNASLGHDFSGVRVHTSSESHALNEQLSAKAFTTGQDLFFRSGAYNPHSSSGQELLAHELTHVVQQSSGAVGGGGAQMQVNAPGDRFEQEADAVAKSLTQPGPTSALQRQTPEEEEMVMPMVQRQELEEDEIQMAELPEEEEAVVQQQELDDEELQAT